MDFKTFDTIPWRWVRLADLAAESGLSEQELLSSKLVHAHSKDSPALAVAIEERDGSVTFHQDQPEQDVLGEWHVPAGYALDVLRAQRNRELAPLTLPALPEVARLLEHQGLVLETWQRRGEAYPLRRLYFEPDRGYVLWEQVCLSDTCHCVSHPSAVTETLPVDQALRLIAEYLERRAAEIKLLADAHRQQAELLGLGR